MSIWMLLQIVVNIVFIFFAIYIAKRVYFSKPIDDPRLSRGLQLLQSKIAVLEDLSDRTETQVKQMTYLLEKKGAEVQEKISAAEVQLEAIRNSMQKSMEVAQIFQDKIPHEEIIERQATAKYVAAAQMAHRGSSADEISKKLEMPIGEVLLITKLNREGLMFSEEQLPEWAKLKVESKQPQRDLSRVFEVPSVDTEQLKVLGDRFRAACEENTSAAQVPSVAPLSQSDLSKASLAAASSSSSQIRPFVFKKMNLRQELG